MEEIAIRTLGFTGPVTALSFFEEYLLVGQGPNILIFDIRTNLLVHKEEILFPAVVHGIKQSENGTICMFGQKSCRITQITEEEGRIRRLDKLTDACEFEDWIWDIAWLTSSQSAVTLALALGHNVVLHWDWQHNCILERVRCEEKCILYCAKLIGRSWSDLVLAAGTVFNQIVLWPVCGHKNQEGHQKAIHRLSGHEGVIFSIAVNLTNMSLCSVSDDRSIRIWQLSHKGQNDREIVKSAGSHLELELSPRKTDENLQLPIDDWHNIQFELKHVLYGHSARVWDARLLRDCIVTVGEDATCLVWNYEGRVLQKFKGHKGKSIWSMAVNEAQSLVATGGGDCSVRLWHIEPTDSISNNAITSHVIDIFMDSKMNDFPRSVALLDENAVLIMTNEGKLLSKTMERDSIVWMQDTRYRSYSLLSVSPDKTMVAVGNIQGDIRLFRANTDGMNKDDSEAEFHIYDGKVMSILWLDQHTHIITSGPQGSLILWKVNLGSSGITVTRLECFSLPKCKQWWISAAVSLWDASMFVCGDRGGSVHVYTMKNNEEESSPIQRFPKIHGKAGVTDICVHGNHIFTSGRDGHYRQYNVTEGQLELMTSNKVFKGFEWIDRMIFQDQSMIILGFHTSKFVVWNSYHNQKLMEVECGGGHRTWDFKLDQDTATFVYLKSKEVAICKRKIKLEEPILLPSLHGRELSSVVHLFSNKDKYICATSSEDTTVNLVQFSYKRKLKCVDVEMSVLKTLQGHLSSVRTLTSVASSHKFMASGAQSRLLFSGGGRAQIKCWRITPPTKLKASSDTGLPNAVTNTDAELTSKAHGADVELFSAAVGDDADLSTPIGASNETVRGTSQISETPDVEFRVELLLSHLLDDKRRRKKLWRDPYLVSNPETRYMALTSFSADELCVNFPTDIFFIAAACSDGLVRLFTFHETDRSLTLLAHSDFHNHCVLCIGHLLISDTANTNSQAVIYSGATDGKIVFFSITQTVKDYVTERVKLSNYPETLSENEQRTEKHNPRSDLWIQDTGGKEYVMSNNLKRDLEQVTSMDRNSLQPETLDGPFLELSLHQSGINAFDVQFIQEGEYQVASGGDDNTLHVTCIKLWADPLDGSTICGKEVMRVSMSTAHAAQITGVQFLDPTLILTVSIDQRIIIWRMIKEASQFEMLASVFVNVSDISNIDIFDKRDHSCSLVVVGVGMQLLDITW